ncbi:MAG: flagellin [Pseudomonadota bacterium]
MSSILTNTSAMVALQTLRGINANLTQTQNEIATGKSIASAKDNSAIWAISKVMESDVNSFMAISESLSLGESTVAVARQASETVSDLLTDMKGKIVAAQEENVDRSKIQDDIGAIRDQINSIVSAAQFNGLNLVQGTEDASILGSLDRASDGSVTANNIDIDRQDLTTSAGTFGSGTVLNANATVSDTAADALSNVGNTAVITLNDNADYSGATAAFTIGGVAIGFGAGELGANDEAAAGVIAARINALGIDGVTAAAGTAGTNGTLTITSTRAFEGLNVVIDSVGGNAAGTAISAVNGGAPSGTNTGTNSTIAERAESVTFDSAAAVNDGDGYRVTFGGETFTYVAGPNETFEDVAKGLQAAIGGSQLEGITAQVTTDANDDFVLKIDNDSTTTMTLAAIGNAGGEASGGLFGLDQIDVTTDTGALAALSNIETLIDTAIDSAASFGSAQGRIELQSDFISKLTDSLKAGIGSLVDADMEEASARLQALQVQQQLGIQSLSIANQAPQSILSLFR